MKGVSKNIKYIPLDYEEENVKYNDEQLEKVADYILNSPKEEIRKIEDYEKQDLYSNKNLFIR